MSFLHTSRALAFISLVCTTLVAAHLSAQDPQIILPEAEASRHEILPCIPTGLGLGPCARLQVPLDWHNASAGTGYITFDKLPAQNRATRKGTVFVHIGTMRVRGVVDSTAAIAWSVFSKDLHRRLGGDYDVVMWIPRGMSGNTMPGELECFRDRFEEINFYNGKVKHDDPYYAPALDSWLQWMTKPGEADLHESLRTREQVIARCVRYNRNSKTRQFIGTAATTHDLVAMADTFDGPGSPIHFLGIYEGSIVGSHLLEMYPERAGNIIFADPIHPITFTQEERHLTWVKHSTLANAEIHDMPYHCLRGSPGCYPRPNHRVDMSFIPYTIDNAREQLMGWWMNASVEQENAQYRELFDDLRPHVDPTSKENAESFEEHVRRFGRIQRPFESPQLQGFDAMGVICGDIQSEHAPHDAEHIESFLKAHMDSFPYLTPSAFPSWQYLCHMWPFRAVERVALRSPQSPGPDQRVLVTLRALSPMNYFRMSADEVRELWPDAELVPYELEYGDRLLKHDECTIDMFAHFLVNGTAPDISDFRSCHYGKEA